MGLTRNPLKRESCVKRRMTNESVQETMSGVRRIKAVDTLVSSGLIKKEQFIIHKL
jgi:hypothetical protein